MAAITRIVFALTLVLALKTHAANKSEADYVAEWCGARDLVHSSGELRLETKSGRYVYADCMGMSVVVEVDFARKYREGIAQATEYAMLSGKVPFLLLIVESEKDCRYVEDALDMILRARMTMILVTTGEQCLED